MNSTKSRKSQAGIEDWAAVAATDDEGSGGGGGGEGDEKMYGSLDA